MTEKLLSRCPSLPAGPGKALACHDRTNGGAYCASAAIGYRSLKLPRQSRVAELFFNLLDFLLEGLVEQTRAFAPRFAFWIRLRSVSSHFAAVDVLVPFLLALEFRAQFVFGHFLTYIRVDQGGLLDDTLAGEASSGRGRRGGALVLHH